MQEKWENANSHSKKGSNGLPRTKQVEQSNQVGGLSFYLLSHAVVS